MLVVVVVLVLVVVVLVVESNLNLRAPEPQAQHHHTTPRHTTPHLMSAAFGGSRSLAPTPPEKGSFPLDHRAECKEQMKRFLDCLREHKAAHAHCKALSLEYLECRMERGLMAQEDLGKLGFSQEHMSAAREAHEQGAAQPSHAEQQKKQGFVGGLSVKPLER